MTILEMITGGEETTVHAAIFGGVSLGAADGLRRDGG